MIDYLGIIVATIAGFIAIIGNTSDNTKTGFSKLTLTGWVACIALATGGVITVVQTNNNNQEKASLQSLLTNLYDRSNAQEARLSDGYMSGDEKIIEVNGGNRIKLDNFSCTLIITMKNKAGITLYQETRNPNQNNNIKVVGKAGEYILLSLQKDVLFDSTSKKINEGCFGLFEVWDK